MESINKNQSIVEAWNRFVDCTETLDDLKLILDSISKGKDLQKCHEVMNRIWDESFHNDATSPKNKEQIKELKLEADRIYAEYQRNRKIPVSSRTITRFRRIWYAAAAALLLGLLVPAVQFFTKPAETWHAASLHYINETTQRGEIKTITLPDQTKVTLNAESRLTYPADFAGERSVELQGEAIFDVTHDNSRPFTVATTDMKVKVLGTVFNVKAYYDDLSISVSVASGKVAVGLRGKIGENGEMGKIGEIGENGDASTILLEKNHQVKVDKTTGNFEKLTIDAKKYLSWTDGALYFSRTPIKDVVNMLNRSCPQMVFELAEGEYPDLITGVLDTKKMGTMLEPVIRSLGLKYQKTGNKVILFKD